VNPAGDFARLLDICLSDGGVALSLIEAYFDESGTQHRSPVLCVAGYIFEKDKAVEFDKEWRAVLEEYGLPFFRMSACAHHAKPFDRLSLPQCVEVETKMIEIINRWMTHGLAVTVQPDLYIRIMPMERYLGFSPYSFCARYCLTGASSCIRTRNLPGDCAYFFESGHRSQSEANEMMNEIYDNNKIRELHRYASHTFIPKVRATPLQAADLLAWQWHTDLKHHMAGGRRRLDAEALLKARNDDYSMVNCDELLLRDLAVRARRRLFYEGREGGDPEEFRPFQLADGE
jgi:hypothetical protein